MHIREKYISELFNTVYKVSRSNFEDTILLNCYNKCQALVEEILSISEKHNVSTRHNNKLYDYINDINNTDDLIKIHDILRQMFNYMRTIEKLSNSEKKCVNELKMLFDRTLKVRGFSPNSIYLFLAGKVSENVAQKKIKALIEYFFAPQAWENEKYRHLYFVKTKAFLSSYSHEIKRDTYTILTMETEYRNYEEYKMYMELVFEVLEEIEINFNNRSSEPEITWESFWNSVVKSTCDNFQTVSESDIEEIKNNSIGEIMKEKRFYDKIKEEKPEQELSEKFQCMGLYHISNAFYNYYLKSLEKNVDYERIAMSLFAYASSRFNISLHPSCKIHAPCFLDGKYILVAPECEVGSNCCLKDNVVIIGGWRNSDEMGDLSSNSQLTQIGFSTTVCKNARILLGTKIGNISVICEGIVLIEALVGDRQIKGTYFSDEVWDKSKYQEAGGCLYCLEEIK